jgi:DNA-binding CsgD family transcriptional regulator
MSLDLPAADLGRVASCAAVLVSPIATASEEDWCEIAARELRELVGADTVSLMLPAQAGGEAQAPDVHTSDVDPRAVAAYVDYYHKLDTGFKVRRRALGAEVWSTSLLWDPDELQRSEYWQDYKVPFRLYDAVGICVQTDRAGHEAGVFLYHGDASSRFGERQVRLLQLTLPAFKAGVRSFTRLARRRAQLARLLDGLSEGVLVTDHDGVVLHMNAALQRTLQRDDEAQILLAHLRRAAHTAAELGRHGREGRAASADRVAHAVAHSQTAPSMAVSTRQARYRVTGTYVGEDGFGSRASAMAILERLTRPVLPRDELRRRHRLTERELDVTYLLAAGKSNIEIMRDLQISIHTAERHTEHVLMKLGLHSRTLVAEAISAD